MDSGSVYDWNGKVVYGAEFVGSHGMTNTDCPFTVKVDILDLNIRKGAETNTAKTGKYTGVGVFTIVEVKEGKGVMRQSYTTSIMTTKDFCVKVQYREKKSGSEK